MPAFSSRQRQGTLTPRGLTKDEVLYFLLKSLQKIRNNKDKVKMEKHFRTPYTFKNSAEGYSLETVLVIKSITLM